MNASRPQVKAQPRVIFFDAAGTLLHLARPVGWHYANVAKTFGAETDETKMEAAFRQAWKELPDRPPAAAPREDDDRPWWRSLATKVLHEAARVPADFDADGWFEALYQSFSEPGVWELFDDVRPALERLRGKTRLAVISNFDGRLRKILTHLGIAGAFEHLVISSEAGSEKPAPQIYRHALQIMQAKPAECWHVGDDPRRDWQGAEAVGIRPFRLHRPEIGLLELASECEKVLEAQASQ